jgi:hypothetical protein
LENEFRLHLCQTNKNIYFYDFERIKTKNSVMRKQYALVLALICFLYENSSAQLIIHEGSNKNYATVADEDGDSEDWIELYNNTYFAIDLQGYSLTDKSVPFEKTLKFVKMRE